MVTIKHDMRQISIRLNEEHVKQLKITAAKEGTSMQKLVEAALENYKKTKFKATSQNSFLR
jgi:predicted DNA binding CopG/RHH family protein